jgi:2'-5' RNA ligase
VSAAEADPPLILTAELDGESFRFFDAMRRLHYPPERNLVPAHVTLFHALPAAEMRLVTRAIEAAVKSTRRRAIEAAEVVPLGTGVVYRLRSSGLEALRRSLADAFADFLAPQDRQGFRPHVTVQNKVTPAEARRLLQVLKAEFRPFGGHAEGLLLWRYLGGPWERVRRFPFAR